MSPSLRNGLAQQQEKYYEDEVMKLNASILVSENTNSSKKNRNMSFSIKQETTSSLPFENLGRRRQHRMSVISPIVTNVSYSSLADSAPNLSTLRSNSESIPESLYG